ncbi:MAG: hypothetical protein AAFP82_15750, partial [Bacteroidota bacterium]
MLETKYNTPKFSNQKLPQNGALKAIRRGTTQQRKRDTLLYKVADFVSAMIAWACFFIYRKAQEGVSFGTEIFQDQNFWYGVIIIPAGWTLLYS